MVEVQKLEFFCVFFDPTRPSAEIGVVEVQKLEFFAFFFHIPARPSAGIGVVEVQKLEVVFCVFFAVPARPSAEIGMVEVQKLKVVFAFLSVPTQPSAEIGVVEVQQLEFFSFFDIPARPSAGIGLFLHFVRCPRDPLRRSCVSKRSRCGAVRFCCSRNGLWKLSRGLRARGRGFDAPLVRGSSGLKIALKRSTRSVLLQLRLELATFKYRRSIRSVLPQLRLENRNF